ncbi:phosphoesterase family-domain-containing protein [Jimgerdemannia flammicorona]|uniref:Phosphoesterase family-domain-containing protein n=1 Tax=Jimgerdemannia flammicorona TaxID=994334 RepID=A0A433CY65_9FUNG|nr:phosphoesterase family-domain-containing protein [Jimgerdemannia flammicorona]
MLLTWLASPRPSHLRAHDIMATWRMTLFATCLLFSLSFLSSLSPPTSVAAAALPFERRIYNEDDPKIGHLVVLMLENHSFDNLFGWLTRVDPRINGLTGDEYNPLNTTTNIFVTDKMMSILLSCNQLTLIQSFDPPHSINDITTQIYWNGTGIGEEPTMMGFVHDATLVENTTNPNIVGETMNSLNPSQIPTSVTLARNYGPTNPNRQFVHSATSAGEIDNHSGKFSYPQRPIYANLDQANITWKVYIDKDTGSFGT